MKHTLTAKGKGIYDKLSKPQREVFNRLMNGAEVMFIGKGLKRHGTKMTVRNIKAVYDRLEVYITPGYYPAEKVVFSEGGGGPVLAGVSYGRPEHPDKIVGYKLGFQHRYAYDYSGRPCAFVFLRAGKPIEAPNNITYVVVGKERLGRREYGTY